MTQSSGGLCAGEQDDLRGQLIKAQSLILRGQRAAVSSRDYSATPHYADATAWVTQQNELRLALRTDKSYFLR